MIDKQKDNSENVMTVQEVSAYLKIPISTIYDLTRKGKLRGVKVGRQWRYLEADIRVLLHGEARSATSPVHSTERRVHPRVRTRIQTQLVVQLAEGRRLEKNGIVRDLSEGGVLFVCEDGNKNGHDIKNLKAGQPVKMVFQMPESCSLNKIEMAGRIVYIVSNGATETGIQFQNLSVKDQEVIQDYVG